jgi:histidinol-phosphate aminotransferase
VIEALTAAVGAQVRLYPDPEADALRRRAARVYGVPADHIVAGNGSDELLALLLRAIIDPGDAVAYPVPTYSLYDTLVAVQGGRAVHIPFPADFRLPAELERTRARLTILCNPNSPSGTCVPLPEIEALAARVSGILVVDEAYADFADTNALGLVGRVPNVVVVRTFSKSFSLAGLRIGLAFGHPELLAGLRTVKDSYNLSRLSQVAALAALDDLPSMQENVGRIRATRAHLTRELVARGFTVLPSEANFVLARRAGQDQGPVARALADANILVRHFAVDGLRDALRITVGTDEEIGALLTALDRVAVR